MKKLLLAVAVVVVVGVAAGLWFARDSMQAMNPAEGEPAAAGEREILYWYDPMRPDQRFDQPGKSPFMDMALVPKYADQDGVAGAGVITIDPRVVQNFGIRTVPVERATMSQELRAAGSVMVDENRIESVQARSAGWVERLHVQALNDPVRKGQLLAEIYSPEMFSAQQEFVLAQKAGIVPLIGPRRLVELEDSLEAVDLRLTVEQVDWLRGRE